MARLPARIRVNATFPFPSLVNANGPVQIAKAGGIWTIGLDPAFVAGGGANPHLIVGSTHIDGGAANNFLFDNGGVLGEVPAGALTPGPYTNPNLTVTAQGVITAIANGAGGGAVGDLVYFDTKALFQASGPLPATVNYVYVRAVSGTYPAAAGLEPTALVYKKVGSTLGLYGEVTLGTQIWAPIYDRNPVNAGQFGLVPDGTTAQNGGGNVYAGTFSSGSSTVTGVTLFGSSSTSGILVGNNFAVVNYATRGAGVAPQTATTVLTVGPTSITLSQPVPFTGTLKFVITPTGVTGTDNAPMIQAAIDFALQAGCSEVRIPYGKYRTNDTLHVGWGNGPYELYLTGARRPNYSAGVGNNPCIFCSKPDRPAINIQGSRRGGIRGITVRGQNYNYAVNGQGAGAGSFSSNPNDWIAPELVPVGTGVNSSGGLAKHAPYMGISIDAYSAWYTIKGTVANVGALPGGAGFGDAWWVGSVGADLYAWNGIAWLHIPHYPARTLPPWVIAAGTDPYASPLCWFSSEVEIEQCESSGFGIGYLNQPNGDGNGDFTKVRRNAFFGNVYHIAFCNGQSRNVEIRNNTSANAHTFLTNRHFGFNVGGLYGPIENNSGGQQYQGFDIDMTLAGSVNVAGHYTEDGVRLGDFVNGGAFGAPLSVKYSTFNFTDEETGTIPVSLMSAQCFALLEGVSLFGYSRLSILNDQQQGFVKIVGGSWETARATGDQLRVPEMQSAVNFTGGLFAGPGRFSSNIFRRFSTEGLNGTYYPTSGSTISFIEHDTVLNRSPSQTGAARRFMSQYATEYQDSTGKRWRITLPTEFQFSINGSDAATVAYPGNVDVMTFGLANSNIARGIAYSPEIGDIIYYFDDTNGGTLQTTSTLFVVTAVGAPNSHSAGFTLITTLQQNNMVTDRAGRNFVSNTNPQPTLVAANGKLQLVKTQCMIPAQLEYATFSTTGGGTSVTNIHRGDGNGTNLAFFYSNGDELNGSYQQWPMNGVPGSSPYPIPPSGAVLSAVTNGTPGSATLSVPAVVSGTFPLFPYELR